MKVYFGRVWLDGHFLWVGEGGWRYILGRWGYVEVCFGWMVVVEHLLLGCVV